jgi:hypothetical protein
MKEEELHHELASIRNIMERSSKFISLSGLSGILAGVYALIGAAFAYKILYPQTPKIYPNSTTGEFYGQSRYFNLEVILLIAFIVFILSISTGIFLTIRKAKKNNQPVWGNTSRTLLLNMLVPLVTGGILILILLGRGYYNVVSPLCLIFYGLALISASNFTFKDVRYLGLIEIVLGLISACIPNYGLQFWAIGFGVLHIVYGSIMYLKYDR